MPPGDISLQGISKAYRIYSHPRHRLMEAIWRGRRSYHDEFWALRDVTFRVPAGTTTGVIGMNGSGKSTLLQVIAGIVQPTAGTVAIEGRIASLLELGAGFNPDFTGRDNVIMNGAIMGFTAEDMERRIPEIEEFAEIGEFIDQPVKTYSSGMFVRLAFAAAIHIDPDILLVDEALAVGDAMFQHRCIRKIREFQDRGKTILFVSHDIGAVKSICSQAVFLDGGRIAAVGDAEEVASQYHAHVAMLESRRADPRSSVRPEAPQAQAPRPLFHADPAFESRISLFRHGGGQARVRNVELLDAGERPVSAAAFDEELLLRVHVEFLEDVESYILGFFFRDRTGTDLVGTNTHEEGKELPPRRAGETLVVDFRQRVPLARGTYSVTVGLAYHRNAPGYFDWVDNALVFEVLPPASGKLIHSKVSLPAEIAVHG
jgi:ABC-type polysaccharide/polyol phosphate transport system ATPase subunit